MDDVLIIGAGPAGLLAAWTACRRGAHVRIMASGIGTTHVSPGWIGVLNADGDLEAALKNWLSTHPQHPYASAGLEAIRGGLAAVQEVCTAAGINYVGDLDSNMLLPTALGATLQAAAAPESFAAGDLRAPGEMLIAAPAGWRDFHPRLCADNLARAGYPARGVTFDLPEMLASSQFDATPVGLARLFDRAEVRERVAGQLKTQLGGAVRVGLPAVIGLDHSFEAWQDLRDRLRVPVFEIPTLPPCVPGIRLFSAFKAALTKAGVRLLLDMTAVRGVVKGNHAAGIVAPNVVREMIYRADTIILATGGLYGGGITSDHTGALHEAVFDLPLLTPGASRDWFEPQFLSKQSHAIHYTGVRTNERFLPIDDEGRVVLANVRIVGRLLANYNPLIEGSTEGVWLATSYRAASA